MATKVKLNKPQRTPGESKKFLVHVKNDRGNIVLPAYDRVRRGVRLPDDRTSRKR